MFVLPGLFFVAYLAVIPLSNWLIANVGTTCVPGGPCLIPVGFGLLAPSGLAMAAFALVLRDLVQYTMGLRWSLVAVLLGVWASAMFADPRLVLASALAFGFSETLDTLVYTKLQRRGLVVAVVVSGMFGIVLDSLIFLVVAFGNLEHLAGQIVGKTWAIAIAAVLIRWARRQVEAARVAHVAG